jgi:uncharacterized membrane protein YphA (DoxX/SURF4 family)
MTISTHHSPDELTYTFNASVLGAPWSFRLAPGGLVWDKGRHSGRIAFSQINRVRMTFRPATMQSYRFITEIWGGQGPKLTIASTSWRSMMEQERLNASYSAFVAELHRRIAAAETPAVFDAGVSPPVYWAGLVVYAAVGIGVLALIARTVQAGAWSGAAVVAVFFVLFLWNGNYFRRNRPGLYRPDALPPQLMPR